MSCQSTGIRTDAVEEARLACSSERKAEDVHGGSGHHPTVVDDLAAAINRVWVRGDPHQRQRFLRLRGDAAGSVRAEARGDAWRRWRMSCGGSTQTWAGPGAGHNRWFDPQLARCARPVPQAIRPGLGSRRRRRPLQGPVRGSWHLGPFRDAELLTDAIVDGDFARYEEVRDHVSMPMFDVMEQIASYNWDMKTLPTFTSSSRRSCARRRSCSGRHVRPCRRRDAFTTAVLRHHQRCCRWHGAWRCRGAACLRRSLQVFGSRS